MEPTVLADWIQFVKEEEELKMISGFCLWVIGRRMVGPLNELGSGDRRSRFDERKEASS